MTVKGIIDFYATFLLDNVLVVVFNDNNCSKEAMDLIDAVKEAYKFQHRKSKKDG